MINFCLLLVKKHNMLITYILYFLAIEFVYSQTDTVSSCEIRMVLGLPLCSDDGLPISEIKTTYSFCSLHKEFIELVKETMTCDIVKKYNPKCSQNFTLAYSELPPYIYHDDQGVMKGFLLGRLILLIFNIFHEIQFVHYLPQNTF